MTEKKKNKIKVTYVKSAIGYNKNQRLVLESLGLKKLNSSNILPDNAAVRGMVFKISHLLKVEENIK
jgi:large subunit ribosomal protein L30